MKVISALLLLVSCPALSEIKNSFKPQLFDLPTDPEELNNLFESKSDVVNKMKKELNFLRNNNSRKNN
jgi:hypothetical protein